VFTLRAVLSDVQPFVLAGLGLLLFLTSSAARVRGTRAHGRQFNPSPDREHGHAAAERFAEGIYHQDFRLRASARQGEFGRDPISR
jgi:hypothetical protein